MTIKEICSLTGKAKNTVCLWCSKIEQVSSKIEQAKKTNIPADFTLEEVVEILRAGKVSESLISLLRENAETKNKLTFKVSRNEDLTLSIIQDMIKQNQQFQLQMLSELKNITNTVNNNILLAPVEKEKISVVEYMKKNKININSVEFVSFIKNVGRQCSDLSRQLQRTISYKKEGQWNVGYYDIDIVKSCVENYLLVKERNRTIFDL